MKNLRLSTALVCALALLATPAFAEPTPDPSPSAATSTRSATSMVRFDAEVDPLAYVAQGHSLHVGLNAGRFRFDLGTFSAIVPEFFHRQKGFENMSGGYGAKLDVFVWKPGHGPFVGIEGAWLRQQIRDEATHLETRVSTWMAGGRLGWHIELPAHFYVKPWIGVGYHFGKKDITVGNKVFHQDPLMIFPTFHVGYVFE